MVTPRFARRCSNVDMGGCQHYGPFLGAYYNTAPNRVSKKGYNFDNQLYKLRACLL